MYHKINGISKIQTSKVYRIYTDDKYRESMYKQNPDQRFKSMYLYLISYSSNNKMDMLSRLEAFYNYVIKEFKLDDEYRIELEVLDSSINSKMKLTRKMIDE